MGEVFHLRNMSELRSLLPKHMKILEKRIRESIAKTARDGRDHLKKNVPIAFSELSSGIVATTNKKGAQIKSTAPHSAAVEVGSRPHCPPLEPLIKWIKLRGAQGLRGGQLRGTTSKAHSRVVRRQLEGLEFRHGTSRYSPVDAPEQAARALQRSIMINGTRPHWYMRNALPVILDMLNLNLIKIVREPLGK